MKKSVVLHKRRNGCWSTASRTWHSIGQGGGSVHDDSDTDADDSEAEDGAQPTKARKTIQQVSQRGCPPSSGESRASGGETNASRLNSLEMAEEHHWMQPEPT